MSGHILKKIAEKIPLFTYESLPEGIRPIGDQDQGGKTWSIKKCDNGDWKRRMLETERGGGGLLGWGV